MSLHAGVPHEVLPSFFKEEVVSISHLIVDRQEDRERHWALNVAQLGTAQICKVNIERIPVGLLKYMEICHSSTCLSKDFFYI